MFTARRVDDRGSLSLVIRRGHIKLLKNIFVVGGFEQAPSDIDGLVPQIPNKLYIRFFFTLSISGREGGTGEKFNLPNTCPKWTSWGALEWHWPTDHEYIRY